METCKVSAESANKRTVGEWTEAIAATYFPLHIKLDRGYKSDFNGVLTAKPLGQTSISLLDSSPLCYERYSSHSACEDTDYFIIPLPESGHIHFKQNGREVNCQPGDFLIEYSAEPYIFGYNSHARITAFKVPSKLLRERINSPEDYCAVRFSGSEPGAALFMDFFKSIYRQIGNLDRGFDNLCYDARTKLSNQLIDLLALAIDSRGNNSAAVESSTQQAHLQRILRYINENLNSPSLTVEKIAGQNGISVRYLHQLFRRTGSTVSTWIRNRRLEECYQALSDTSKPKPVISELAYKWGFSDQANFNRLFKSKYSMTPREVISQAQRQTL